MLGGLFNNLGLYANEQEQNVDKFFSSIKANSNKSEVVIKARNLIQKDIISLNLWLEKKYKKYRHLNKTQREKRYSNFEITKDLYQKHKKLHENDYRHIYQLQQKGVNDNYLEKYKDMLKTLHLINTFTQTIFQYRESTNFAELLRNPLEGRIIGDCNQIVTLYLYFFSLDHDVTKLRLNVFDNHITLHLDGLDIEATRGYFTFNTKQNILSVEEIIGVNILDISDKAQISDKLSVNELLEMSQIAYMLSSSRDLVKKNLANAYKRYSSFKYEKGDYETTIKFAELSNDTKFLRGMYRNVSIQYLNKKKYSTAEEFAKKSGDVKLISLIRRNKAVELYNNKDYQKALDIAQSLGDDKFMESIYSQMYFQEQSKLGNLKSVNDIKSKKHIIYKMKDLAKKSKNQKAIEYCNSLIKYL